MALALKALTRAVTMAIVQMRVLFITGSPFAWLGGLAVFPKAGW